MKIIDSVLLAGLVLCVTGCDAILGLGDTKAESVMRHGMDASRPDAGSAEEAGRPLHENHAGDSGTLRAPQPGGMDAAVEAGSGSGGHAGSGSKKPPHPVVHPEDAASPVYLDHDGSVDCAEGDASCRGIPLWKPSAFPGLVLWLDAARGVVTKGSSANELVSGWKDQSGRGNDAAQSDAKKQPVLLTGAANGLPAIQFNGVNGQLNVLLVADAANLNCGTNDFVIETVAEWSNTVTPSTPSTGTWGYGCLFSKQQSVSPYQGIALWANYAAGQYASAPDNALGFTIAGYIASSAQNGLNDARYRLYAGRRVGGTGVELRINGSVSGQYTIPLDSSVDSVGSSLEIGGVTGNGAGQGLDGVISEIAIICGPVLDADLAKLEAYFNDKYRLWR